MTTRTNKLEQSISTPMNGPYLGEGTTISRLDSFPLSISVPQDGVVFAERIHEKGFSIVDRKDDFYKLIFVLNGRVEYISEQFGHQQMDPGTFFPVPLNHPHSIVDVEPSTLLLLCLGTKFMESDPEFQIVWKKAAENFANGARPFGLALQEISSIWKLAIHEQMGIRFGRSLSLKLAATRILLALSRISEEPNASGRNTSDTRVKSLIDSLEKTFFEEWNLEKAASAARLSKKQFTKLFKIQAGTTFLNKLTELRIEHACTLLARTQQSILSIAFSCGFQDLSHFHRVFKRFTGNSPMKWRKDQRA